MASTKVFAQVSPQSSYAISFYTGSVDIPRSSIEEVATHPFYPGQDPTLYPTPYPSHEFMSFGNYFTPTYPTPPQNLSYPTASTSTSGRDATIPGPLSMMNPTTQLYETHDQHNGAPSYVNENHNGTQTYSNEPANGSQSFSNEVQPFATVPYPSSEETLDNARTLIGPLAASAQTINDENDEPGIFFLFQDLSVRTEGTFRLRMRLVNVGGYVVSSPLFGSGYMLMVALVLLLRSLAHVMCGAIPPQYSHRYSPNPSSCFPRRNSPVYQVFSPLRLLGPYF